MNSVLILLCGFAVAVLAGPVKRDCGETCFNSTNECGASFGGCWDDCTEQRPTFTAPLCPVTIAEAAAATPTATPVLDITIVPAHAHITPGPDPARAGPTPGCRSGTTICLDYLQQCGGQNMMYGGCDDICSSKTYTAPPCSVTPVPTMSLAGNGTGGMQIKANMVQRPPAPAAPCDPKLPKWMCRPLDW